MSQLIAMIVCVDEMNKPEVVSEFWRQALPQVSLDSLDAARYLDDLEEQIREVDWALISIRTSSFLAT
jgi:hypothetical protein